MNYDPAFVAHRPILAQDDLQHLHCLGERYSLGRFKDDGRNYEEVAIDFVYTSAKIEGNTYDRLDTDNLLKLGITAGGKRYSDAVMLLNLRSGFDMVMTADSTTRLDVDYVCGLHKVLMKDLLPSHEQGIARTTGVIIGASRYRPLPDAQRLRTELKAIMTEADKYADPFEKAIYLHCNLAYLQYFRDGNKRTARMMQTGAMVQAGIMPMLFSDTLIDQYVRALVNYYETGQYQPYIDFFKTSYERTISNMQGEQCAVEQDMPGAEQKPRGRGR